jgi:hypothetical protein
MHLMNNICGAEREGYRTDMASLDMDQLLACYCGSQIKFTRIEFCGLCGRYHVGTKFEYK